MQKWTRRRSRSGLSLRLPRAAPAPPARRFSSSPRGFVTLSWMCFGSVDSCSAPGPAAGICCQREGGEDELSDSLPMSEGTALLLERASSLRAGGEAGATTSSFTLPLHMTPTLPHPLVGAGRREGTGLREVALVVSGVGWGEGGCGGVVVGEVRGQGVGALRRHRLRIRLRLLAPALLLNPPTPPLPFVARRGRERRVAGRRRRRRGGR